MQVLVKGRAEGKTTALVKWLLEGREQEGYPAWSRVIVCAANNRMVQTTEHMLRKHIEEHINFHSCDRMLPHTKEECPQVQERFLINVRKAVWGLSDYYANEHGTREFEFAIDDMEYIWERGYRILRQPSVITVTGSLYDNLGH